MQCMVCVPSQGWRHSRYDNHRQIPIPLLSLIGPQLRPDTQTPLLSPLKHTLRSLHPPHPPTHLTSLSPPVLSPLLGHILPRHLAPPFQRYHHASTIILRIQVLGEFENGLCGLGGVCSVSGEIAYFLVADEGGEAVCDEDETCIVAPWKCQLWDSRRHRRWGSEGEGILWGEGTHRSRPEIESLVRQ